MSYVYIRVCGSVPLHSGTCVLNGDGESGSHTERLTHPDEARRAEGERRGDTMGRVTDQDTSIIICLLATCCSHGIEYSLFIPLMVSNRTLLDISLFLFVWTSV